MEEFSRYCFFPVEEVPRYTIGEGYGTETFCWFLYSVIRMEMPRTVVEIGSGAGVSTIASALALKQNGHGVLWSIDDGRDWPQIKNGCQSALGYREETECYAAFRERLVDHFGVSDHVRLISETNDSNNRFAPNEPIDVLFIDANGPFDILWFYLPRMSPYGSLFIDGISTKWGQFLLVEQLVDLLNHRTIPSCLGNELSSGERTQLESLISMSKFTLVHLVDRSPGKVHHSQNGRCWIQIRPVDIVADGTVPTRHYNS